MKKSWQEKMADKPKLPKTLTLEKGFPCYNAVHSMGVNAGESVVLVNASEIIPIMQKVPKGKLITIIEICKNIAKKHKTKGCCSLVSGIHVMTIANTVSEIISEGIKSDIAKIPYWRTVKSHGELNPKYPGGLENHAELLKKEGFKIEKKGKRWFIKDWEKYLIEI